MSSVAPALPPAEFLRSVRSSEKYEPAVLPDGDFFGTPEEGFDVGAVYLQG